MNTPRELLASVLEELNETLDPADEASVFETFQQSYGIGPDEEAGPKFVSMSLSLRRMIVPGVFNDIKGKAFAEAQAIAEQTGFTLRITSMVGRSVGVLHDMRTKRLNVGVDENETITHYNGLG